MSKRSILKTINFIIITMVLFISPLFVSAEDLTYTEAQNMVKEVMKQYYVRGPYFQYNYAKALYYNLPPEEGTVQDNKYTVCAGYTHNVYNQAFGIKGSSTYMNGDNSFKENSFPQYNYHIIYAAQHAYKKIKSGSLTDNGNLLIYYQSTVATSETSDGYTRSRSKVKFVTGDTNTSSDTGDFKTIVKKVKPGDLVVYTGHALIVYDTIDTDGDGTKDDVLVLNATGGGNEVRSRIEGTSRLYYTAHKTSYTKALDYLNLEEEGIFRIILMSSMSKFMSSGELKCSSEECAIIRPFYKGTNSEAVFNFQQTISKTDTAVKKSAIRVKYPSLLIEKTVSKGDNNSIYIGDELTYTIKVTNRSDITPTITTYPAFTINETLDSNVTCTNCTGWTVSGTSISKTVSQKLLPGESVSLTYTVKVKDDVSVVGKTITSTGSFYDTSTNKGILGTGTVENKVIPKVVNYKDTYANCYDTYKGSYKGLALIDKIYSCALGKNFNFSKFKFTSLYTVSDASKTKSKIVYNDPLDANHTQFQKMILNNYINGLAVDANSLYYLPRFTTSNITRARTINAIDFKEGDVLIYDIVANEYTHEVGTYAYIYKGGAFVGVNGSGMTLRNAFNTTYHSYAYWNDQGIDDYLNITNSLYKYDGEVWSGFTTAEKKHILYQSLYGKDNYIILRPELVIKEVTKIEVTANPTKTSYIQNYEKLNLSGGTIKVTYNDGTTATKNMSDSDVTVTGFSNTTTGTKTLTVTHEGKTATFTVSVVAPAVTKIEVTTKPTKTTYIQNYNTLNLNGGKITATYDDNSTETIDMTDESVTVTGYNNKTLGTNTLTVTYKGKSTTFTVTIVAKSLTKIEVTTKPTKTTYIQNYNTLNLNGGKITATYDDKSTETIDMTDESVTVTGYNNKTLGTNTLTVTYKGKSTTFTVTIVEKSVTKIEVVTTPTKTSYIQNYNTLNLTGGTIKATYDDKSTETIDMTDESVTVTGYNNKTLGTNTLTVTYKGKTTTFTVTIVEKSVTKIEVVTTPTKTSYIQNYNTLNLTGGTIKATYDDKSTETIDMTDENVTVTGYNNKTLGTNTLTVTYKGKSTTFTVTIVAKSLTKIEVTTTPTKTTYIQNYNTLNLNGGKITATYDDKSTETIDMTDESVTVTGYDNKTLGTNTLTVTYKGKTTTFTVTIVEKSVTKIEVVTTPTKTSYIQNYNTLNLTGGTIKATYDDKSTETIDMTDENVTVTGYNNKILGTNTLTVTYKGKSTTFTVTIVEKTIKTISVSILPTKTSYIKNYETLDLTGGKITATYNDKSTETIDMTDENVKVTGFDNKTVGEITLTVTYKEVTTTFKVNIVPKKAIKLEISKMPTKTTFIVNYDDFTLSGGELKITYDDTSVELLPMGNLGVTVTLTTEVSNRKFTTVGETTVKLTYDDLNVSYKISVVEKSVTKIEVTSRPTKTKYIANYETLNLAGGTIKATYNDTTTETISMTDSNVSVTGFTNNTLGDVTLTVTYKGKTTTFYVTIVDRTAIKLEVITLPNKTTYIESYEKLNLYGGTIKVTYNNETSSTKNMIDPGIEVTGFNNTKVGKNTITITYKNVSTTFDVTIVEKSLTKIEVSTLPTKTSYIQNYEELNLAGGKITATYNDTSTETIDMTNENVKVTGFNNKTLGDVTLTVTYKEKTTTFKVSIVTKLATKIEVTSKPTKTSYIQNYENLNLTGGKIKVTYNDTSTETINMTDSNVTVTGFDNTTTGTKTITVKYKDVTTTFTVTVVAKSITKIEVTSNPSKTTYIQNYETLKLDGGKIKATYNDTSTETIEMTNENVKVTGFSNKTIGDVTLTVTYKEKTATFKVNVVAKSITKIEVSSLPTKTSYIQNKDTLDLSGGKIKVTYDDTSTETINMTDEDVIVTGFSNTTLGEVTLTVTYKEKTTTFKVTIIDKVTLKETFISKGYKAKDNYIHGFEIGELLTDLKNTIKLDYQTNGKNKVATGIEFKYNTETLTAVLYGDLNGDGVINSADLLRMRQHLLNLKPLTGAYKEAGLIENKTTINSADLLRIRQHLLNIRLIQQQ